LFTRSDIFPLSTEHHFSDPSIQTGNISAVEALLSCDNVDVNAKNNDGETPLHYASKKEFSQIIDLLISHGADLSVLQNECSSSLDKFSLYAVPFFSCLNSTFLIFLK